MIDVSDGIATDARHIAKESNVSLWLDRSSIPVSSAVTIVDGEDRVLRALCDGEDFELLFTAPPDTAQRLLQEQPLAGLAITHIGEVRAGEPDLFWMDGSFIASHGYEHGAMDGRKKLT
jgi:thiamine-monophosphate kinase